MIVDAWAQHPTARHRNDPMFESLRRWTEKTRPDLVDNTDPPIEYTLRQMDEGAVDLALISAWEAPHRTMISNDEVAGFVAQANGRLRGVGSVNLAQPMQAVREIRRCVKELKFVGIRLLPWLWELPPTHARYYPIYAECCELGIPFCTQVGHTGPLMPSEFGRPIPYIDQVAIDFPELKIVGGHIGYPWTTEMIAVCTKHPNVYIDTSAYTVNRYPPELVQYLKTHGKHKVLFGTNWPMISAKHALADLDKLGLESETQKAFLSDNAIRVYGLSV